MEEVYLFLAEMVSERRGLLDPKSSEKKKYRAIFSCKILVVCVPSPWDVVFLQISFWESALSSQNDRTSKKNGAEYCGSGLLVRVTPLYSLRSKGWAFVLFLFSSHDGGGVIVTLCARNEKNGSQLFVSSVGYRVIRASGSGPMAKKKGHPHSLP